LMYFQSAMLPDPLELSEEHLNVILDILDKIVPDRKVRAFGSRVTGKAKPYSDLDLAVMGDTPLPDKAIRDLRDAFEESNLPFQVDIVQWAEISEGFRKIIEERYIVLIPKTDKD